MLLKTLAQILDAARYRRPPNAAQGAVQMASKWRCDGSANPS